VQYDFTYLSLGAGVQSTAMLVMSALGLHGCPKADCAMFADTGDEPSWVYDHLETLKAWSSIPIHVTSKGHLSQDVADRLSGKKKRFAAIPAWTRGQDGREAPLRRQCTREYKIEPLEKKVRELLGYRKYQHNKHKVACLLGISTDEISRMKPSRTHWITNLFPLIDAGLSRIDCTKLIKDAGLPVPKKSACVFCPYHDDRFWHDMKANHPDEFAKAVSFDNMIRDMTKTGIEQQVFLHRSLQPLDQIDFGKRLGLPVINGFNAECEGLCGN
jgi:hypothetical protein